MNNVSQFLRPRGAQRLALGAEVEVLIGPRLQALEEFIAQQVASDVAAVAGVGRYVTAAGGKRIRPTALLLGLKLCDYRGGEDLSLAAAVELIHTATLIHDDVIDGAGTRRGRKTVNRQFGDTVTVLIGDHIYAKAMRLALRAGSLPILDVISDMTLKMVEGELLQYERSFNPEASLADYYDVIRRKTAHLFASSLKIAGLASGVDEGRLAALDSYGTHLGLAFQITDDLLDFTGSQQATGKPVLSDLAEGKLTLPAILAREARPAEMRPLLEKICRARKLGAEERQAMLRCIEATGALTGARNAAAQEAAQAEAALRVFPPSAARSVLMRLPELVLERSS